MDSAAVLDLAKQLIEIPSVSPDVSGVQSILIARLHALGFSVQEIETNGCRNFWARLGTTSPLFVFSGHTDVVAAGDDARWTTPAFSPNVRGGNLFGRGASDMKAQLAAMIVAVEMLIHEKKQLASSIPFSIGFLVTGDEELGGPAANVCLQKLAEQGVVINYCLVGEPSSEKRLGDTLKVGRRGSMTGVVTFTGQQGHVGYPHLAENALHAALEPLHALSKEMWADGGDHFLPTTLQITSIKGGVADNVIPGEASATFNLRYSYYSKPEDLQNRVESLLKQHGAQKFSLQWSVNAEPFLTSAGKFSDAVVSAVLSATGEEPAFSTAGGTSDARHFAKHGISVIEAGPINESIHKVDEHISVAELAGVSELYREILTQVEKCLVS